MGYFGHPIYAYTLTLKAKFPVGIQAFLRLVYDAIALEATDLTYCAE